MGTVIFSAPQFLRRPAPTLTVWTRAAVPKSGLASPIAITTAPRRPTHRRTRTWASPPIPRPPRRVPPLLPPVIVPIRMHHHSIPISRISLIVARGFYWAAGSCGPSRTCRGRILCRAQRRHRFWRWNTAKSPGSISMLYRVVRTPLLYVSRLVIEVPRYALVNDGSIGCLVWYCSIDRSIVWSIDRSIDWLFEARLFDWRKIVWLKEDCLTSCSFSAGGRRSLWRSSVFRAVQGMGVRLSDRHTGSIWASCGPTGRGWHVHLTLPKRVRTRYGLLPG